MSSFFVGNITLAGIPEVNLNWVWIVSIPWYLFPWTYTTGCSCFLYRMVCYCVVLACYHYKWIHILSMWAHCLLYAYNFSILLCLFNNFSLCCLLFTLFYYPDVMWFWALNKSTHKFFCARIFPGHFPVSKAKCILLFRFFFLYFFTGCDYEVSYLIIRIPCKWILASDWYLLFSMYIWKVIFASSIAFDMRFFVHGPSDGQGPLWDINICVHVIMCVFSYVEVVIVVWSTMMCCRTFMPHIMLR